MPDQRKKFYLTTPIYYVNARPHIGHAYTTIAADVLARRHRLLGEDVFFLTGTDEHGQKIERSAAAAGIPPQQFADEVAASFAALWQRMGITNDKFIRTTSPEHKRGVQELWRELESRGAIYPDSYTGAYCVSDETFVDLPAGTPCPDCGRPLEIVTEENYFFKLSEYQLKLLDLIESGELSVEPEARRKEVLSFIRGNISAAHMSDDPVHESEVDENSFLAATTGRTAKGTLYAPGALKNLSISRTSFKWGIPVPGNEKHVVYVWLDALTNYMSAVGYGADVDASLTARQREEASARFARYWPADLHLVGKEIIRFHCVYWPAFLLAAGLPLPKKIQAHGWLLFEESKMSKSRGNIVRTETILDAFGEHYRASLAAHNKKLEADAAKSAVILSQSGAEAQNPGISLVPEPSKRDCDLFAADVLRYFLLREIPFGQDGSFSFDALITRYNADLANGYGNLVSRVLKVIKTDYAGCFPQIDSTRCVTSIHHADELVAYGSEGIEGLVTGTINMLSEKNLFGRDMLLQLDFARYSVDAYLSANAPWKLSSAVPDEEKRRSEILYTAAESIRIITALLYPVMPHITAKVWRQLGLGDIEAAARNGELKDLKWGGLKPGTKLGTLAPIFPRAPKELAQGMADMEAQNNPAAPKYGDSGAKLQNDESGSGVPHPSDDGTKYGDSSPVRLGSASLRAQNDKPLVTVENAQRTTDNISAAEPRTSNPEPGTSTISIDDFAKVDLRVARVLVAERIPKADKLLRLEVDLGPTFDPPKRQILAGIAQFYEPEKLVGRKVVIVANLAPRKMRGLESQGMVVAASVGPDGAPVLAGFLEDVEIGARLK